MTGNRQAGAGAGSGKLSREVTASVNGVFLLCVFFRHLFQYRPFAGAGWQWLRWIDAHLGQFIVVSFLFFSGYGVMESVRREGAAYVRDLPRRRVLATWLRFLLCLIPYPAAARLLGTPCPLGRILPAALAWESVGNSNWYIFVILCLYLLTWAAWHLSRGNETKTVCIQAILTAVLAAALSLCREEYWYNTIFTYTAGMAWSVWGERWMRRVVPRGKRAGRDEQAAGGEPRRMMEKDQITVAAVAVIWAGLWILCLVFREWVPAYQLAAVLAGLTLAVGLTMPGSRTRPAPWRSLSKPLTGIFRRMGRHLFGLYMMQRLPMLLLAGSGLGDLPYMLLCLLATLLLGWLMDVLTARLVGALVCGGHN